MKTQIWVMLLRKWSKNKTSRSMWIFFAFSKHSQNCLTFQWQHLKKFKQRKNVIISALKSQVLILKSTRTVNLLIVLIFTSRLTLRLKDSTKSYPWFKGKKKVLRREWKSSNIRFKTLSSIILRDDQVSIIKS